MKLFWLSLVVILAGGCFDGDGLSNTPKNKAAHGHTEGEVNELKIGDTLLRFPAGMSYNPVTSYGKVIKGQAQEIGIGLAYPELYESSSRSLYTVPITLKKGFENVEYRNKFFDETEWRKIIEHKDLELIEYQRERFDGSWGHIVYKATGLNNTNPKGSVIKYSCQGWPPGDVVHCRSYLFNITSNLIVSYLLPVNLLPYWRKIHSDVIELVEKLIVKNENRT